MITNLIDNLIKISWPEIMREIGKSYFRRRTAVLQELDYSEIMHLSSSPSDGNSDRHTRPNRSHEHHKSIFLQKASNLQSKTTVTEKSQNTLI